MDRPSMRAIVTGGAQGIGYAVAERLTSAGGRVAILDRDGERAAAAATELGAVRRVVDVRDGAAVDEAVGEVVEELGGLDVVVNNAGTGDLRLLHTVDDRVWRRVLDVNLTGAFNTTRATIPHLVANGRGSIVNNASLSGLTPTRGEAAYSAAKAGLIALTRSTALEYGPEIRCNGVAPGFVRTPLTAIWDDHPEALAVLVEAIPLGRLGEATEVADLIEFLCSERATYITGQTITIDGGLSLPQAGTDAALARLMAELAD